MTAAVVEMKVQQMNLMIYEQFLLGKVSDKIFTQL